MSTPRKSSKATLFYSVALALILGALALLPELARPKHYPFLLPGSDAVAPLLFPLQTKLSVLSTGSTRKTTVQETLGGQRFGLVNFWATWCPPCIEELPSLEFLSRSLANKTDLPLKVVAISVDEKVEEIPKLFKTLSLKPTFSMLWDAKGDVARQMGSVKFPESFLIDAEGKVLHKWVGPQDWLSGEVIDTIRRYTEKTE